MRNGAAILFNSMFYAHNKPKKFYSDNNFIFASIDRKDKLADIAKIKKTLKLNFIRDFDWEERKHAWIHAHMMKI